MNKKVMIKTMGTIVTTLLLTMNVNAQTTGSVTASTLNVRSGPGLEYSIVNKLKLNSNVDVLDIKGNWYEIKNGSGTAYVHKDYVRFDGVEAIITESVNFRTTAEMKSENIIMQIPKGETIQLLEKNVEFSYINYKSQLGYIYTPKLQVAGEEAKELKSTTEEEIVEVKVATVVADILNVRKEPTTSSSIVSKLYYGSQVEVLSQEGSWVNIKLSNGTTAYVHGDYVKISTKTTAVGETTLGEEIIKYAEQFIGTPYVYGGNSLQTGVDCSGFTQQVYKNFGIYLNRTSSTQFNNGVRISREELRPGDLVFYGYNGVISHVAIYKGNNQVVHSSTPGVGVVVGSVYNSKPYIGAVRVTN